MQEPEIFGNLNDRQKEAVTHTEGPLLILAGAGSGKTRVITHRIAYLIQSKGVAPDRILAITFTNKAAEEMKERLRLLLGYLKSPMWVSTFHAACVRILRREIAALGYNRNFVIYDADDQRSLVRSIVKEFNLDEKRFPPRAIQETISRAKNQLLSPEAFDREVSGFYDSKVAEIYACYQSRLKNNNALDFDDLIMQTVLLFSSRTDLLKAYQEQFEYVLVDEYQDTNHAQYMLIKLLTEARRNICVVGDDDQSIYGWRGADINNILDFEQDYPDVKVIRLEQNYRSTKSILAAANNVVCNNAGRKGKSLWTENEEGEKVTVFLGADERAEARYVIREVGRLRGEEGYAPGDIAIFYRTNAQSRVLEEAFISEGIPYTIVGTLKFYERREIKDVIAYLRLLANPADNFSMARVINVPRRGIGEVTWSRVRGYAEEKGIAVSDALLEAEEIPGVERAKKALVQFGRQLQEMRDWKGKVGMTKLTLEVLSITGYVQQLEAENTEEALSRLENIQEFLSVTQEFDRKSPESGLEDFLESIALISDVDSYAGPGESIVMMTLHSAKGLEFPVVFITGMEEGLFPHSRSMTSEAAIEEERRLCYVGMTRARERLYLIHTRQRTLFGNSCLNEPSRFLREISPELMQESQDLASTGAFDFDVEADTGGTHPFRVGDKVYHEKWGDGTVVDVDGTDWNDTISVAFPGLGIKRLLPEYAPLRKIQ